MSSSVCVCVCVCLNCCSASYSDCVFTPYYDICMDDFFLLTERERQRE